MNFTQVREYIRDLLAASFTNKQKLDKIDEDNNGFLVYNNTPVNSPQYGFTPVGTVISLMGNTAPANYLICDGTVYNIADYRALANYFEEQFGSSNHFGGDGTTTFAVPDLRGEFLRGTGTNGHTNQGNGTTVGDHQDATIHVATPLAKRKSDGGIFILGPINESFIPGGSDTSYDYYKEINVDKTYGRTKQAVTDKLQVDSVSGNWSGQYAARPTNTSILYCIAVKNIYMGGGSSLPSGGSTGQILAKKSNTDDDVEWKDEKDNQYTTMPTASVDYLNKIVQYIGTTTESYTNGLFYECVSDGQSTPTYSWALKDVQTYPDVDLTNVFASGLPIGSVTDTRAFSYSNGEQIVGTWINGKPLYQKTIPITLSSAGNNQIAHNISNVDTIMADLSSSYVKVGSETFVLSCINQGSGSYINDVNLNWINATKLNIIAGANRLGSGYITLRYTKTTD